MRVSGLSAEQDEGAIEPDAFGPLTAERRRVEANHYDLSVLLPRRVRARDLGDADDIAAVLRQRVAVATARPAGAGSSGASGSLGARSCRGGAAPRLIEARADAVLDEAVVSGSLWISGMGGAPVDPRGAATWRRSAPRCSRHPAPRAGTARAAVVTGEC